MRVLGIPPDGAVCPDGFFSPGGRAVLNHRLKDHVVNRILSQVRVPAQYMGGELNMVRKDHRDVRGKLCMAFPDTYTIGTSHHGLQVLYTLMNDRADWVCERAFTPWTDMEEQLRNAELPLYSLETFTPLVEFDVLGFTLQYEICYSNVLTMLDLGGVALRSVDRTLEHPLVIAGGPCAQNPEPMSPFIDLFVTGDGEPSLPLICDRWLALKQAAQSEPAPRSEAAAKQQREELLAALAAQLPFAYVPRFYEPEYFADGSLAALHRTRPEVPETIEPALLADLDAFPLPSHPIVPYAECVHDRISIEIMRGCPWQCRFCQSTVIKRPLRFRTVDTIVRSTLAAYHNTGFNEVSLLSLSSSDYPHFEELVRRMQEVFRPLGVHIALPSLRVNDQLQSVVAMMSEDRRGLTLAPEVARDDMREQIRKKINNEDLYNGCREAFRNGWQQVKLYFLCGLPGERTVDLDGIVDMAETISRIGKEERGRNARVVASVSNFIPKPHTPYQWNGMQRREYFERAHRRLRQRCSIRAVQIKCHNIDTSLLEGVLCRGDRRIGEAIELAWRRGARLDSWYERLQPDVWWQALLDSGSDMAAVHRGYPLDARLPWDHINVRKGRTYLEKEQSRAVVQLSDLADAR